MFLHPSRIGAQVRQLAAGVDSLGSRLQSAYTTAARLDGARQELAVEVEASRETWADERGYNAQLQVGRCNSQALGHCELNAAWSLLCLPGTALTRPRPPPTRNPLQGELAALHQLLASTAASETRRLTTTDSATRRVSRDGFVSRRTSRNASRSGSGIARSGSGSGNGGGVGGGAGWAASVAEAAEGAVAAVDGAGRPPRAPTPPV